MLAALGWIAGIALLVGLVFIFVDCVTTTPYERCLDFYTSFPTYHFASLIERLQIRDLCAWQAEHSDIWS